jgi:cytochrome c oxidase subunit IV
MADQAKSKNLRMGEAKTTVMEEYLYVNLLWWGFLAVLAAVSYFVCGAVWDDVTSGVMEFIFVILGGGFTLVSAMDYLYEKHYGPAPKEMKK